MYKFFIALRYITHRVITVLGVITLALAVAIFVVVMAVLEGFGEHMRKTIRSNTSHVDISEPFIDGIRDYETLGQHIDTIDTVSGWTPYVQGPSLIQSARYRYNGYVRGVEIEREYKHGTLKDYIRIPRSAEDVARETGLGIEPCLEALESLAGRSGAKETRGGRYLKVGDERKAAGSELLSTAVRLVSLAEGPRMRDVHWQAKDMGVHPDERDWILSEGLSAGVIVEIPRKRLYIAGDRLDVAGSGEESTVLQALLKPPVQLQPRQPDPEFRVPGVLVGDKIWTELELVPGDRLSFTVQAGPSGETSRGYFEVIGTFKTGSLLFDHWAFVSLPDAQKLFKTGHAVSGLGVWLRDHRTSNKTKRRLDLMLNPRGTVEVDDSGRIVKLDENAADLFHLDRTSAPGELFGGIEPLRPFAGLVRNAALSGRAVSGTGEITAETGKELMQATATPFDADGHLRVRLHFYRLGHSYRIRTWWDQQADWFEAMEIENRMMRLILFLFFVMIGVFILVILYVIVAEKVRDIGLLVAVGGRRLGVVSIFVLDGLFIGIAGAALGLLGGVLLANNVNEICDFLRITPFPQQPFKVARIPVLFAASDLLMVVAVAVGISFLAGLLPAWRAARMDPVECLRHE